MLLWLSNSWASFSYRANSLIVLMAIDLIWFWIINWSLNNNSVLGAALLDLDISNSLQTNIKDCRQETKMLYLLSLHDKIDVFQ